MQPFNPLQKNTRSRYWCFTQNHPVKCECHEMPVVVCALVNSTPEEAMEKYPILRQVKYMALQLEQGEAGTKHLQGYLVWFDTRSFLFTKKNLLPGAHWEKRRGNHEQAKAYVTKDDTRIAGPWFWGDDEDIARRPGQRTDIQVPVSWSLFTVRE